MTRPVITLRQKQRQLQSAREKADLLNGKARLRLGKDYAGALALAAQAERLAEKSDHPRGVIASLLLQSACHSELGRTAEGMGCAMRALRMSREQAAADLTIDCLHKIGIPFMQAGDYRNALKYFRQMEALCREHADFAGQGTALCMIGGIFDVQGNLRAAGDAFNAALALARRESLPPLEARALVNVARMLHAKDDYTGAIALLLQSRNIYLSLGNTSWVILLQADLGAYYTDAGDLPAARAVLLDSLRLSRAGGAVRLQSIALINLSEVESLSGRPAVAARLAQRSLKWAQRDGNKRHEIYALNALGKAEHVRRESALARRLLSRAQQLARATEDREALQTVKLTLKKLSSAK